MSVSVVVVTHDFEPYLARALDSVFAQDLPPDEVVVVDDGSTDGTPALMEAYTDRVRYVRTRNRGHLSAYDRGISEAGGDHIALLDGDDEWLPHKLRAQVALLEARPDVGLVHGDMRVVDAGGAVLAESFLAEAALEDVEGDLLPALVRGNTVTTSALMVRGALRDRFHPIPDWARVQDWWIAVRVAEVAAIACLREPVALYRRHGSNLNHGRAGRRRAELLRAELPLRRRLLTGSALPRLSVPDAVAGLEALEAAAAATADALELPARVVVPPDRRAAEARVAAAAATPDRDAAARHLVAALAHDPANVAGRLALKGAGALPARERLDGARAFAVVADARELCASPALLAAHAATFSDADDVTLVVRLGPDDADLEALTMAVAAAGLDRDGAADLLAVPAAVPAEALARCVDAVLSARLPDGPLAALPCADETGIGALARLAAGRAPAWAINVCAPDWDVAPSWGDLHFARALQQALHRREVPCAIHPIAQWGASRDAARFPVVLHLKGLTTYEPNPRQRNLLWCISHPERLTDAECDAADRVLVASAAFAAALRERTATPVDVLEQATDPDVFFPEPDPGHARELVFVGNSRRVMRRVLADLLPTERDLAVWGGGWDGLIESRHVVGTYLPNDEVRRAYASAGIVLNDHWDDMREHGFASNRLYDAVASGALVVSDRLAGLEERFGGAVVTYETREELARLVAFYLAHPEERAARAAAGRELVLARHTFAHRADALLALAA